MLPIKKCKKTFMLAAISCTVFLFACANPKITQSRINFIESDLLAFIQVGDTSKGEILSKLGYPNATFNNHKILSYYLKEEKSGGVSIIHGVDRFGFRSRIFSSSQPNLILVFDQHDVLSTYSILVPEETR